MLSSLKLWQVHFRHMPATLLFLDHLLVGVVAYFDAAAANDQPQHEHSSSAANCQPATNSSGTSNTAPNMHVVAIGTGTKCLGASKRSAACDVINDSHAEVVARRAFVAWLYQQLQLAVQMHKQSLQSQQPEATSGQLQETQVEQQQEQVPMLSGAQLCQPAYVWCPDTCKFGLRSGVKFAMYVSQPPCGDASINSAEQHPNSAQQQQQHLQQQQELQQHPAAAGRTGAKLIRLSGTADVSQAAAAIAGTAAPATAAGTEPPASHPPQDNQQQQQGVAAYVPSAADVEAGPQQLGVLRRKPGKGDPTLSLSCSDKLARWACLGLQGCLLSSCLAAPVYLDLLVMAVQPEPAAGAPGAAATAAAGLNMQSHHQQQRQEARLEQVEAAGMRAFAGRLQGCAGLLQAPFALRPPVVVAVQAADAKLGLYPDEARKSPSGDEISKWYCCLQLAADAAQISEDCGA
jgi:tRNA-specific adenosine deaminase 1